MVHCGTSSWREDAWDSVSIPLSVSISLESDLSYSIFEHEESEPDCLRLLVGVPPNAKTGPAKPGASTTFPVSPHYARLLADLALQRGFDGYLLNFEAPLRRGVEQTRALTMWIAMFEHELKRKIGDHAEVIW